jgi:hypothetical protein
MELVHVTNMKKIWDRWGIALSGVCLFHCIAVILLPMILPALEVFVHIPWIHRLFAFFVLITTPLAFIPGFRRHGFGHVLSLAILGVSCILAGVILDGSVSEILSHIFSIAGSIMLVAGHWLNMKHSQKEKCC